MLNTTVIATTASANAQALVAHCPANIAGLIARIASQDRSLVTRVTYDSMAPGKSLVEGQRDGHACSMRLDLWAISTLIHWPSFAAHFDYPGMVHEGDWSGVRDSSEERITAFFNDFILPVAYPMTYLPFCTKAAAKKLMDGYAIGFDKVEERQGHTTVWFRKGVPVGAFNRHERAFRNVNLPKD